MSADEEFDAAFAAAAESMMVYENRLKSFTSWVFKNNRRCKPANLAKAGFVYIGSKDFPDLVKCHMCDKQLDGWEPSDDPMKEHREHAPNCPLMNLHLEESRIQTFRRWPAHLYQATVQEFAAAGFYHDPAPESLDQLICFSCNKPLDGWEYADDPWEEHKSHSSKCAHINGKKPRARQARATTARRKAASKRIATANDDGVAESDTDSKGTKTDDEQVPGTVKRKTNTAKKVLTDVDVNQDADNTDAPSTVKKAKSRAKTTRQTTTRKAAASRSRTGQSKAKKGGSKTTIDDEEEADVTHTEETGTRSGSTRSSTGAKGKQVEQNKPDEEADDDADAEMDLNETMTEETADSVSEDEQATAAAKEEALTFVFDNPLDPVWQRQEYQEMTVEDFVKFLCDAQVSQVTRLAEDRISSFKAKAADAREKLVGMLGEFSDIDTEA